MLGQGDDGAGLDAGDVPVAATEVSTETAAVCVAVAVAVAEHLVQIVDTEVRVTVETVLEVAT